MMLDIEFWPQLMPFILVYRDSKVTISRAYTKVYNGKSRHISLRYKYIKQLIEDEIILILYVGQVTTWRIPLPKVCLENW